MCEHHLADGPLVCTRADAHTTGHVYESAGGDLDTQEPGEDD